MGEADKVLNPPIAITQEVMEDLKELSNRAETLNMNLEQQEALDTRLGAVKNWLSRAKAAMNDSSSEWQLLTALVKEAKKSQFNLPEVPLLAEQQAEQAWVGQAEIALSGPAQLEDLQQLDDDSARLAESGRAAEMAKKISIKLAAAKKWEKRLAEEVLHKEGARPAMKEATALISECNDDQILLPALDDLRAAVTKAKGFLESVRRTQSRSTRGVATRATLPELRELYDFGQSLPLTIPEVGSLALQINEAVDWEEKAEAAIEGASSSEGGGGVNLERLQELVKQSENLSVAVAVSATLKLRLWREELMEAKNPPASRAASPRKAEKPQKGAAKGAATDKNGAAAASQVVDGSRGGSRAQMSELAELLEEGKELRLHIKPGGGGGGKGGGGEAGPSSEGVKEEGGEDEDCLPRW